MLYESPKNEIQKLENEIFNLSARLLELRKDSTPQKISNYKFKTQNGDVSLLELFGDKDTLFVIHNMGQACRYCTLWADGLNGFVQHLESQFALAMVSKDDPETQRLFANSRGWRFKMASHKDSNYMEEQTVGVGNAPGLVCFTRKGNDIYRKNATQFGPGDTFCPQWNILSMAGLCPENWTPQFNYWQRPMKMDDGGQNLI